jgi:hypothetical protein
MEGTVGKIPKVPVSIDPRDLFDYVIELHELLHEEEQKGEGQNTQRVRNLRNLIDYLRKPLLRTLIMGAKATAVGGG